MTPPIHECAQPLVDIRQDARLLYGPPPECPETQAYYCLLRVGVYERILRAQADLPVGCRLRLYEGLRSLQVQHQLFQEEKHRVSVREPTLSPSAVHARATLLVSPVRHFDGSPNIPPHSTGAAVDLEIVDADGSVIDFGMEIRDWTSVSPAFCAPEHPKLGYLARQNRSLLAQVMWREGFVRFDSEWWHFSYGDQYWARKKGLGAAIYGACTSDMIGRAWNQPTRGFA